MRGETAVSTISAESLNCETEKLCRPDQLNPTSVLPLTKFKFPTFHPKPYTDAQSIKTFASSSKRLRNDILISYTTVLSACIYLTWRVINNLLRTGPRCCCASSRGVQGLITCLTLSHLYIWHHCIRAAWHIKSCTREAGYRRDWLTDWLPAFLYTRYLTSLCDNTV